MGVAFLLVEGSEVADERERAIDWLDGELLGRGRLGRGWEMGSLHVWMGRGGGERRWPRLCSHAWCWHSPSMNTNPGTLASASAAAPEFQEGSKLAKHTVVIRGEGWASRGWHV